MPACASVDGDLKKTWQLAVDHECIDFYLELLDRPRDLSSHEATKLVELVDAWRALSNESISP